MSQSRTTCLLAAVTLVAASSVAAAQPSPQPLPVRLGQTVWVTTSEGLDMKGVVSGLSPTTLEVSGEAGTRQFLMADMRRVAKRDGNRNGFLIGAGVGVLPFVLGAAEETGDVCYSGKPCSKSLWITAGLLSAAIWGGIGALIDNAIEGRETIYTRPISVLEIAPVVSRSGFGVRGSVRW